MSSPTPAPPRPVPATARTSRPLTDGPRWYRSRIRGWGPFLALILPGVVGAIAYAALKYSDAAWSGAVGLFGGVLAAPGLLLVGAPFGERDLYPFAVLGSGLLWMLVGYVAARRATRNPMAAWPDFWRHYFWLLFGIWAGSVAALMIATISLGEEMM